MRHSPRLRHRRIVSPFRYGSRLAAVVTLAAGVSCTAFDSTRVAPVTTLGEDLYGAVCDRLGASVLAEDVTARSYHSICHHDDQRKYGDKVDESALPPPANATTKAGR